MEWAGFKGMKNGELLQAAEASGYQVLLTVDNEMPCQQTTMGRGSRLARIQPGESVVVPLPG